MDRSVKDLIDETSDAFTQYDCVNADYASFAAMALNEFKVVLRDPELTATDLRRILRHGDSKHRLLSVPPANWSSFMAQYVMKNVNENIAKRSVNIIKRKTQKKRVIR